MNSDLINSINALADNVKHLDGTIRVASHVTWWNTQWFSAFIGAAVGLIFTFLFSFFKNRNRRLSDFYQWFLEQGDFSDPQGLLLQAMIVSYPENKPLGEKMVIEFRSHIKHWYEPVSWVRFLLGRYEKSLWKIKNGRKEEVVEQKEYKEAERRFKKVMDFVYKKTGENEWTN